MTAIEFICVLICAANSKMVYNTEMNSLLYQHWDAMEAQDALTVFLSWSASQGLGLLSSFWQSSQILSGVKVQWVSWPNKHSDIMVIEPAFGSFGTVGRSQVLSNNKISISRKLVIMTKHKRIVSQYSYSLRSTCQQTQGNYFPFSIVRLNSFNPSLCMSECILFMYQFYAASKACLLSSVLCVKWVVLLFSMAEYSRWPAHSVCVDWCLHVEMLPLCSDPHTAVKFLYLYYEPVDHPDIG